MFLSLIRALQAALVFMTIVPIPQPKLLTEQEQRWSQFFYPFIGLIIGLLLWFLTVKLPGGTMLSSAIILLVWVSISGALHLDGVGDCADAWLGGIGSKERTLEILKDPRAGSMAVVTLVLLLLLKFIAIDTLIIGNAAWVLLLVPMLARATPMFLFSMTTYVRQRGIGSGLVFAQKEKIVPWVMLVTILVVGFLLVDIRVVWVALPVVLTFVVVRSFSIQRLGGFTGDVAGATIELSEVVACVVLALLIS